MSDDAILVKNARREIVGVRVPTKVDKDTLTVLAPRATGSNQLAELQAALDDATALGLWFSLNGDHVISGELIVPSGAKVDGTRGTLTQTGTLKAAFRLTGVTGVRIRDVKANGLTSDYVNNSGVYGARAVYCAAGTTDVRIENCTFLGWAGAGVHLAGTASDIHITGCKMTGAGSGYILNTTYNYSGGIVTDTGASTWSARGNDISGFAQGIVSGDDMVDVRITDNYIHDIPGQHGLYVETLNGGVIANNLIRNPGLLGMKIQIGTTTSDDADSVVISDNVFINTGAQGILLDNPPAGAPRFRRVSLTGNVVNTSAGYGIEVKYGVGIHIADNAVYNSTAGGIRVSNSSIVEVVDNRVHTCAFQGISLTAVTDITVDGNRIINPASANGATTEFGIHIVDATTSDLTVRDNKITDALGNMRYGIYVESGDTTTMDFVGNRATGATDYGCRFLAAGVVRTWANNTLSGTTGTVLGPPTSAAGGNRTYEGFASAAPASGTWAVGDRVWNTAPAASGTMGWVCTTAGTPGTWKTFGAISA